MAVHVDQTWGYDQTGHIHHGLGIRRVQVFATGSNFAILNGKVTKFHSSGAGVVRRAALQNKIIRRHPDSLPRYCGSGPQVQKSVSTSTGILWVGHVVGAHNGAGVVAALLQNFHAGIGKAIHTFRVG